MTKYQIRLYAIAALMLLPALWFWWRFERETQAQYTLYGDAMGYYLYLPATFIYHNLDNITQYPEGAVQHPAIKTVLHTMQQEGTRAPNGRIVNQYTYGIALMEAPFFLIAHGIQKIRGAPATGFEPLYAHLSLRLSSLLYTLLGLLLLYRLLRRHFTSTVSLLATGLTWLGTNLFYFSLAQTGMAHVPLFFLYAALLLTTVRLYERPVTGRFLVVGLLAGLITVIRPTDIICLLVPLGYGVYNKHTMLARCTFLRRHWKGVTLAALFFLLPALPQLAYWKFVTGSYLFYSYGSQGFNWLEPQIIKGLFYPTNGWLYYTPLMGIAFLGLLLYRKFRPWLLPILAILPLYIYIIYSWWCYNYINGLGSRPMIHLYPLLALPLAATVYYFARQKLVLRLLYGAVVLACVIISFQFTVQASLGLVNTAESSHAYNRAIFLKTKLDYPALLSRDLKIDGPPPGMQRQQVLQCLDFNSELPSEKYVPDSVHGGMMLYTGTDEYPAPAIRIKYSKDLFRQGGWLRGSGLFYATDTPAYYRHLMVLEVKRADSSLAWYSVEVENKIGLADNFCAHAGGKDLNIYHLELNRWGTVYFYVPLPEGLVAGDEIAFFLWNIGHRPMYLKNLCLELWR